jgi:hypothetical protein
MTQPNIQIGRARQPEPDIGLCFKQIGHSCRSERTFNAITGRFVWACEADHCPVRQGELPIIEPVTLGMRVQGGGSKYRPPARKRR